jgi:hypothetical protein
MSRSGTSQLLRHPRRGQNLRHARDGRASPADLVHRPFASRAALEQMMAGRFQFDRASQDARHRLDSAARANRLAHVHLVVVEQAQMELALRREGSLTGLMKPTTPAAPGSR